MLYYFLSYDLEIEINNPIVVGETWVVNYLDTLTFFDFPTALINFKSNNMDFIGINTGGGRPQPIFGIKYYLNSVDYIEAWTSVGLAGWTDEAYRTVTFLEPPTGDLLTWLQANAVKQN